MLHIFWLVIRDLFVFVTGRLFVSVPELATTAALPQPVARVKIAAPKAFLALVPPLVGEVVPSTDEVITLPLHAPVVMYVCDQTGSKRYIRPQVEFDGCIEMVPYGTAVSVVGYSGRYASVLRAGHTGWMLKDSLVPDKGSVWPHFIVDDTYPATHDITKKVRSLIGDAFGAGELLLPLQASEYITVRLMNDHRHIIWPAVRPRVPGSWQQILRGLRGIHSSITPKTDTVMEWLQEPGEGRLAYVESVTPDNTITITLIGLVEAGRYTTLVLTEVAWRELRPVFIEVQ